MKKTLSAFFALITLLSCIAGCTDNSSLKDTTVPDTTEKAETTDFADTTDGVTDTEETTVDISDDTIASSNIVIPSDIVVPSDMVLSEDYSINPHGGYCFFSRDNSLYTFAYSVYKMEISYEEFWSVPDVREYIAKTLSVMAGTEVSPESFEAYLINPGAMYPATIVIPVCDEYNLVIPFAINQDANFVYDAPHKLYGKYKDNKFIKVSCSTGHKAVNGNEIERTISQSKGIDFDKVVYRELSMSEAEKKITVPLISDTDIHVAVLKIEDDLTYSLESYKKIYPETLSAYDFFVTYRSFGFKPTDLIGNDYGIPLSPESEILRVFGTLEVLETMDVSSEFPDYPYTEGGLAIRTQAKFDVDPPGISVHFRLKNKLTGEYITKEDIESDITIYDFEWVLDKVDYSK